MKTIAVIDDDQMLLDLMAEILAEYDATILAVQDRRGIVELIGDAMPNAILLDIRLSDGTSGWDILETLQAEPYTASIPVILWSGDVQLLGEKREWLEEKGIPVLPKPFDIDELYDYLDIVLNKPHIPLRDYQAAQA